MSSRAAALAVTVSALAGCLCLFPVVAGVAFPSDADWTRLRMGLAVAWKGGPFGQDRQLERFRHLGGAPHAPLSTDPADWLPLDIREYEALAADEQHLYAAHDGLAWGQHVDRKKPGWKATIKTTLTRYDVRSGQVRPFQGSGRFTTVSSLEIGPGSARPTWKGPSLAGLALLAGRLYLSDRARDSILVLDAGTAKRIGAIPLDAPGALAVLDGQLLAVPRASDVPGEIMLHPNLWGTLTLKGAGK